MNIILTGAGKGIGFETARNLATEGTHKIIAVSRDISKLAALNLPGLFPYFLDLEQKGYEQKLVRFFRLHFDQVDVLINNAGYLVKKSFQEQSEEDFDRQFHVNVKAPFQLIQACLPYFKEQSHIVNISSMGGFQGSSKYPGLAVYSSAKAALIAMTECLALELKDRKISVNCLALGGVQTEMYSAAFPGAQASETPAGMADFIARFALNGHQHFNGKVLPVTTSNP